MLCAFFWNYHGQKRFTFREESSVGGLPLCRSSPEICFPPYTTPCQMGGAAHFWNPILPIYWVS
jgi:hypothetical protein